MGSGGREKRDVPKRKEEGGCESRKQGAREARKKWVCGCRHGGTQKCKWRMEKRLEKT